MPPTTDEQPKTQAPRTGLDEFFDVLKDVRRMALATAGGLIVLPIAAQLGGFVPPWPPGMVGITTLIELVILMMTFQLLAKAPRARANRVIVWLVVLLFVLSSTYLLLNSIFVFQIPNNPTRVVLGCGLSDKAILILKSMNFQPTDTCPGEFATLLASSNYEPTKIWTPLSVSMIRAALALTWLGAFGTLAAIAGVFVSFQRRQRAPQQRTS